ncbi:MAG TPA: hypothetical protein ENN77_01110, partial [Candidatus Wirthbacteria bacterium]|nr:hypothetical protein [Candidatus Wirthbacteria bacterium]
MLIDLLKQAQKQAREALLEHEVYQIFATYELDVPAWHFVSSLEAADQVPLAKFGDRLVLKVADANISHKSDLGGVVVVNKSELAIQLSEMLAKFKSAAGILVMDFLEHSASALGGEIMFGVRQTEAFGAVLTCGPGGSDAEQVAKMLAPNQGHRIIGLGDNPDGQWADFFNHTAVVDYFLGRVRGKAAQVEMSQFVKWAKALQNIVQTTAEAGFEIQELEINPLSASHGKLFALDALFRFQEAKTNRVRPGIRDHAQRQPAITALLNPQTVGVIGVSSQGLNPGRVVVQNLLE